MSRTRNTTTAKTARTATHATIAAAIRKHAAHLLATYKCNGSQLNEWNNVAAFVESCAPKPAVSVKPESDNDGQTSLA